MLSFQTLFKNAFFKNIASKLASKITNSSTTVESYINKPDSIMETKQLSMNELKDAFFSLKINKSPGYDDISSNVLKKRFSSLCESLKCLFNLSIEKGIFADGLKIAKVTPIYKAYDKSDLILLSKNSRTDIVQLFVPIFS